LSSITSAQRGQALVVFTVWLFLLLVMAALAFDVGQTLLDRRAQQNAADAAALAGSRYLTSTTTPYHGFCSDAAGGNLPVDAACDLAVKNGYPRPVVRVDTPPGPTSIYSGVTGYIQVTIATQRTSFIQGRLLPSIWSVSSMGVATNGAEGAAPYSFLVLNKTICDSMQIAGNGSVVAGSNIQVNSSCPSSALKTQGNAQIDITSDTGQINVVGGWSGGGASIEPTPQTGQPWQPDPLAELPPPTPVPGLPMPVVQVSGSMPIPSGCPGGSGAATPALPALCQFPSSYAGTVWRLYPGYYPGGLKFQSGTYYFEPGIYYVAGGGLDANGGGAALFSVDAGSGPAVPIAGGVLVYNTQEALYAEQCAGNGTFPTGVTEATACIGPIKLNGSSAPIQFRAIQDGLYKGIVIFQDRTITVPGADIQVNGSASNLNVIGTIYAPSGEIVLNGSAGTSSTDACWLSCSART